jgi:hypothetical protein
MILERLVVAIDSNLTGLTTGLKKAGREVESFDKKATQFGKGFAQAATATVAATVAVGEFTAAGGKSLAIQSAFARRVGDSELALGKLRRATRGLVSDQELMTQANVALTLGSAKNADGFAELAAVAQQLGRSLGLDTAFALNSLNVGIARQSRLVLDNVGLIVKLEDASKNYASTMGIVGRALTDVEQKEAFRIEAMDQARLKIAELGGVVLNAGDAWVGLKTEIANAVDEMQKAAAGSGTLQAAFEGFRDFLRTLQGGIGGPAQAIIDSLGNVDTIETLQRRYEEFSQLIPSVAMAAGTSIEELQGKFEALGISGGDLSAILLSIEERIVAIGEAARVVPPPTVDEWLAINLPNQTGTGLANGQGFRFPGAPTVSGRPLRGVTGALGSGGRESSLTRAITELSDSLVPLGRPGVGRDDSGGGIGSSIAGRLKGIFDPTEIASNIAASLATGGLNAALGFGASMIGSLFGGVDLDEQLQENARAIRENTAAILSTLAGSPGQNVGNLIGALQQFFAQVDAGTPGQSFRFNTNDNAETRALIESLGLEVPAPENLEAWRAILELLGGNPLGGSLSGRQQLAQTRIGALDIDDPAGQFAEFQKALAQSLPSGVSGLGASVARLGPDTIDGFLQGVLGQIEAGTFDFSSLGSVSLNDFLASLGQLESLADSAEEASGALSGLAGVINAPRGFKVALLRFRATDTSSIDLGGDTINGGLTRGGGKGGTVNIETVVVNPGAGGDGRRVYDEFQRELRLAVARGGADDITQAAAERF